MPISSDISINGSASIDPLSYNATGGATQGGTLSLRSGGVLTQTTFTDLTVNSGPHPLTGSLTQTGDSIGAATHVAGTYAGTTAETQGLFIDYVLNIANNSPTDTYEIIFQANYSNTAQAAGSDAYVRSEGTIVDPTPNELFFTLRARDTGNGDNTQDSPTSIIDLILAPNTLTQLSTSHHDLRGGAYAPGSSFSGNLDMSLVLDAANNLTAPAVPLPGSLWLFGSGLAGLLSSRRLTRRRATTN
ncbi:MAG: PEP-CTERM sorting domain-containing protein [Sulfuricaulis sp.]